MPDLKSRDRHESSVAGAAMLLLMRAKPDVAAGNFDLTEFMEAWNHAVAPRLEQIHRAAFKQLADQFAIDYDPSALSRRYADRVAKKLGKEIAKGLDKEIERITEDSEGDAHRAELLNDLARDSLDRARAKAIGVTETTRAISLGERDAVKRIERIGGIILKPRWFTEDDGRVCEICDPLHGKRSSVWVRRFPFGPPAHVNCRCWLEYDEA